MSQESKHQRRSFSDEFKRDAVNLIVNQGYSFRAAADAVGVGEGSLRLWHRQLAPKPEPAGEDASLAELKPENQRLRRGLRQTGTGTRDLKQSHGVLREGVTIRYAWIREYRDSYPVGVMCRVLQVSTSGYYRASKAEPGPRAHRSARIHDAVAAVFESSNQVYGSAKIARTLETDPDLETACRNTVAKAMREMGLKSRVSKKFRPSTTQADPSKTPANQKWVADITYLPTAVDWVYLAVVLDLFSRKVVVWDLSESLATPVVSSALRQAVESRSPTAGELLHHSDRGCQYTSDDYQSTLRTLGITCSMSRTGCCYDNAVMERFFWSLKHKGTKFESFGDLQDARLSVFV